MSVSESDRLRKEGNKFYLKGIQDGLSPFLAKDRLSQALKYYFQARSSARTSDELSSSLKNIGKTNYQIAKIKSKELQQSFRISPKESQQLEDEIKFYAKESLNGLFSSLSVGSCKPQAWQDKMHSDIAQVFSDTVLFVSFGNFDRRVAAMFALADSILWVELRALLFVQIASVLYKRSVQTLEAQDFRSSLRSLHEMNYPLEEAGKITSSDEMRADIRVLKTDAIYQLASAESMQVCSIAVKQLDELLNDLEYLNINMVFDTLDLFKDGALKAREINLEQEAIACFYQGHIFERILKLKQKAKTFYMQVMELTEAAKPKLFTNQKWYQDCVASLKVMQDEARERDDKEQGKIKEKLRKQMEKELNAIKAAGTTGGATELLKHVYSKHPPKSQPPKLDVKDLTDWDVKDNKTKKRILMKALNDYHPDKNSKDEYGVEWHFLVQEISKNITSFHDRIKSCD
ncbi:hypothetical protein HOLleu_37652 [Holothuria leucospilota]|uniref:J domain-containing protein n=1 Tax=Holothuria leucospilota TaxID=206669 RepID=A0A9Q1BEX2_HOLLE|nr:hypothetical protein HOLleu_37652 [Holothuria leucospilota]